MSRLCRGISCSLASVLIFAASNIAAAQSVLTEHTFKLDDADSRPAATLEDVSWLVGSWTGEAFGSTFEEVWNPPSAGSMIGMWKLLDGDKVNFYELLLLAEEEDSLSIKVKHFGADFIAWEDKEDYLRFRLVKIEQDAVYFSGLSFERINDNEIHGYIVIYKDGKAREEKMIYRRNE